MNSLSVSTRSDELLKMAQQALLQPYAISEKEINAVFASMMAHKLDYADLYFQYSRAESWSLEEGIVFKVNFR